MMALRLAVAAWLMAHRRGSEDAEVAVRVLNHGIIGAAIEVHRSLGPGLLESTYEACLARELEWRGIPFQRQVPLPVHYRGTLVDCGYRLDFVVAARVIVEVKAVAAIHPIHASQLLTYLRLKQLRIGLLLNFNVHVLRHGIRRILNP